MDKAQFEQIKQHGAMLAIASHLYKCGLITDAEYHKLTAQLQKKYCPATDSAAGVSPASERSHGKSSGKGGF